MTRSLQVAHASAAPPAVPAETLSRAAASYANRALSDATRRAYSGHLRAWETWCAATGATPAPASPAAVANHLAEMADRYAYVTLGSRLSAIVQAHMMLRMPFDAQDRDLRKTLQGIARTHGTRPQRQATPLLTADILRLVEACPDDLRGLRDRALILLGFAGAFRRAELVAITVEDLTFARKGVAVFLARSKADQEGEGATVRIEGNPKGACPVAALRAWLTAAGIASGPVFRRVLANPVKAGDSALSTEAVRLILKDAGWRAGYTAKQMERITPHSLRAGCITTLAQASTHERDIMAHSRHTSQATMRGYIRGAAVEGRGTTSALWKTTKQGAK